MLSGFQSPYANHPINDRIRRRNLFGDKELMQSTITNFYLGYQQVNQMGIMHQQPQLSPQQTNCNLPNLKIETETKIRPKISFSIESIIGSK